MKIYLATSWRNPHYGDTRAALINAGHHVYDFKSPRNVFAWKDMFAVPPDNGKFPVEAIEAVMETREARAAWFSDYAHLNDADACVLLLPAGNSAHLEAGLAHGKGTPTVIYVPKDVQLLGPELMWRTFRQPGQTLIRDIPALLDRLTRAPLAAWARECKSNPQPCANCTVHHPQHCAGQCTGHGDPHDAVTDCCGRFTPVPRRMVCCGGASIKEGAEAAKEYPNDTARIVTAQLRAGLAVDPADAAAAYAAYSTDTHCANWLMLRPGGDDQWLVDALKPYLMDEEPLP